MTPTTIVVFPWRSTDEDGTEHTGWAAQLASHDCGSQGDTDLAALQNVVNWFRLLQTTDRLAGTLAATPPGNDRAARATAATTKHDRMVETQVELRRVAAKAMELEAQVAGLLERPCKQCSRRPTDPDNVVANPAMPGDRVLVTDGIHTASIRVDPEAPFRNVSMDDIAQSVKSSMDRWGAVIVGGGGGRGGAGAAGAGGGGGSVGKGSAVGVGGVGGTPFAQEARATYVATSSPAGPAVRPFATEKPQRDLHDAMREIVAAPLPVEQPESLLADVTARVQRYIDTLRALPEAERDAELQRIPHELLPGVSYLLRTMPTRKAEDGK